MTAFIAENFVPLMFAGLFVFLLTGIPVAFGLAATGLLFGFIGMEAGLFPNNLFPLRIKIVGTGSREGGLKPPPLSLLHLFPGCFGTGREQVGTGGNRLLWRNA